MDDRDVVFVDEYGRISGETPESVKDTPNRSPLGLVKLALSTIHGFIFGDSSFQGRENPYKTVTGTDKAVLVDEYGFTPGQTEFTGRESVHKTVAGTNKIYPVYFISPNEENPYRTVGGVRKVRVPSQGGEFPDPGFFYWPLASGGAVDLKEYAHGSLNLTNNNSVTRADGPSNNLRDAAAFARGSSQSLSVDNAIFNPGSRPFGVAVWAYRSTEATDGFSQALNKYTTASRGWALNRVTATNRWQFRCSADGTNDTATSAASNDTADNGTETWNFIAGWWDGAKLYCQVNMKAPLSIAFAGPVFDSVATMEVGGSESALRWDGRLSQGLVWIGRVPSQAELAWLYNNGQGRDLLELV